MNVIIKSGFKFLLAIIILTGCIGKEQQIADLVFQNGIVYTADSANTTAQAVAVAGDRIIGIGTSDDIQKFIADNTKVIDLKGKTLTPGFIEGHGHIMGLGFNEMNLDLMNVKSYDELVQKVAEAVAKAEPGQWILGRGWHQSKWNNENETMVKGFQTHEKLSAVSPNNPVFLRHASGHAGFANAKAMEISGVGPMAKESLEASEVVGGEIIRDELGNPTGIFNERAQELIAKNIPETTEEMGSHAFDLALEACLRNGITSFTDAGSGSTAINRFERYKKEGKLSVRLDVMISSDDPAYLEEWYKRGPEIDSVDHLLSIRSIKLYCDGALGSRGAWLLEEYTDRPGHFGMPTTPMEYVLKTSENGLKYGFQVCSHAIGDRANREVLDRYEKAFKEAGVDGHDVRFRIEHAQHIDPADIPRFGEMGVIPAMQAIHLSSDRPWAIDRLGEQRIKEGAYMWQSLIKTGAVVVNGTDVPVESINPLASFYASVSRKTLEGTPEGGYEPAEKMTREQALKSYTWNAAYGTFQENVKGSIEIGKLADFTIFSKDIMTIPENDILNTKIAMTIVDGKIAYKNEEVE
ncbi:MAG TPA: amidohydrolase [Fulvivirga sp.]|nr:amidohydrolase [Fulvivirga sp.]